MGGSNTLERKEYTGAAYEEKDTWFQRERKSALNGVS